MTQVLEGANPSVVDSEDTKDIHYFHKWLKAAKKGAKRHWDDGKAAYEEYEYDATDTSKRSANTQGRYPLYWSSVKTLEPAYYARSPKIRADRSFEINDELANTACLIIERLGNYLMRGSDFDAVMSATVLDFINADKAAPQIIYEVDRVVTKQKVQLQPDEFGALLMPDGLPPEPGAEILSDESGQYVEIENVREIPRVRAAVLPYNEVLHTPDAKMPSEITEMAYYFCMTKERALERFGEEKLKNYSWKTSKSYSDDEDDRKENNLDSVGKYLDGWEIFCKDTKKIYWVSEGYKEDFLDVKDDDYKLRSFFPSPNFAISSKPSKSLYPTPAYVHCEPTLKKLHNMQGRIFKLVDAIRRRCLVDGSSPELLEAINDLSDREYITVKNLQSIVEKQGLANMIHWVPIQELVQAIPELTSLQDEFKNQFYEWFGVPDILRGFSDPIQTAAATEIQQQAAHDRFKKDKKRIQDLARDTLEMMIDMALEKFPTEHLVEVCGMNFTDPAAMNNFMEVIEWLKNDEMRLIRVEVETDSTTFVNDAIEQRQAQDVANLVTAGLDKIAALAGTPDAAAYVPVALQTLLLTLETLPGGKKSESAIKQAVKSLLEKAQNPPPPPPPPPDYEAMKIQLQQAKLEADRSKFELQQQTDAFKAQVDAQTEQQRLSLEAQQNSFNNYIKEREQLAKEREQVFAEQLQSAYLMIDEMKAQMLTKEQAAEEIRLAMEAETARISALKPEPPVIQTPPAPNIPTINVHVGGKKMTKLVTDELGNPIGAISETVPE